MHVANTYQLAYRCQDNVQPYPSPTWPTSHYEKHASSISPVHIGIFLPDKLTKYVCY